VSVRRLVVMVDACTYVIELEPAEPTGYAVMVPALPGAFSYGATAEEAMANAREAIALHIEGCAAVDSPCRLSHRPACVARSDSTSRSPLRPATTTPEHRSRRGDRGGHRWQGWRVGQVPGRSSSRTGAERAKPRSHGW
jgi:predicted RNase H-like HicB family nuclease